MTPSALESFVGTVVLDTNAVHLPSQQKFRQMVLPKIKRAASSAALSVLARNSVVLVSEHFLGNFWLRRGSIAVRRRTQRR